MMISRPGASAFKVINTNLGSTSMKYSSIPGIIFWAKSYAGRVKFSTDAQLLNEDCVEVEVYKNCPLCPARGFEYTSDGKPKQQCSDEIKANLKQSCAEAPAEKAPKETTKAASEKSNETCGERKPCITKPKPKPEDPPEMKPKQTTATKCPSPPPKKEPVTTCKKKPPVGKKTCSGKPVPVEECECSILPWPFNLLQGKKKPGGKKKSDAGKKKMVAVTDQLSVSGSLLPQLFPQPSFVLVHERSFHLSSINLAKPVCPQASRKVCPTLSLPKETEKFMAKLRALARANKMTQDGSCVLMLDQNLDLQPKEGWQAKTRSILIRDPEVIKREGKKKVYETPRLIPRKLRK